jgi:hypothetical protein
MDDTTPTAGPEPAPAEGNQRLEPGATAFLTMGIAAAVSLVLGVFLGQPRRRDHPARVLALGPGLPALFLPGVRQRASA